MISVWLLLITGIAVNSLAQDVTGGTGSLKKSGSVKSTKSSKPSKRQIKSVRAKESDLWDFKINVDQVMYSTGTVKEEHTYEWVVRLNQMGTELKGAIVNGRTLSGEADNVCADAAINGSIQDGKVDFVITYSGSCCAQEQMKFIGKLADDGKHITGNIQPRDTPRPPCHLWYGQVEASKR
jgi:hypothetical protein